MEQQPDGLAQLDVLSLVDAQRVHEAEETEREPAVDEGVLDPGCHVDSGVADSVGEDGHHEADQENNAAHVDSRVGELKPCSTTPG